MRVAFVMLITEVNTIMRLHPFGRWSWAGASSSVLWDTKSPATGLECGRCADPS